MIAVINTLAEPKASFAGFIPVASLARSKALMAASNEESALSRLLGRWDLISIVEVREVRGEAVWCKGCEGGPDTGRKRALSV